MYANAWRFVPSHERWSHFHAPCVFCPWSITNEILYHLWLFVPFTFAAAWTCLIRVL
jgi:hypothetical protein